jgi:hypothetical protein
LRRVLGAIFPEQSRSHFIEQALDPAPILQGAFEDGDHRHRDIEAAPATFFRVAEQVVGVLVAAGADRAMGSDAGLINLGQGPFEGGPAPQELVPKLRLNRRKTLFWLHKEEDSTYVCI